MVVGIDEDGPAKRAGLFAGDILTAWNGEAIAGVRDVYRRLGPDSVGATVVLDVIRANQPAKIEVVVGERAHK
jgi:S1-C subfamily serine protease